MILLELFDRECHIGIGALALPHDGLRFPFMRNLYVGPIVEVVIDIPVSTPVADISYACIGLLLVVADLWHFEWNSSFLRRALERFGLLGKCLRPKQSFGISIG